MAMWMKVKGTCLIGVMNIKSVYIMHKYQIIWTVAFILLKNKHEKAFFKIAPFSCNKSIQ